MAEEQANQQQYFTDILSVVFGSDRPLNLETIAYKTKVQPTNRLLPVLIALVQSGYLQTSVKDGKLYYQMPTNVYSPLRPLPYYLLADDIP